MWLSGNDNCVITLRRGPPGTVAHLSAVINSSADRQESLNHLGHNAAESLQSSRTVNSLASNSPLRFVRLLLKLCLIVWASPYSLIGLSIGAMGLLTGGRIRLRAGAIECFGGSTAWVVRHLPTGPLTIGVTLGHVILGQSSDGLIVASDHERVHVRQFERWGPIMGPAYLLASGYLWLRGLDAYRDNPFEVEAYRKAP